MMHASELARVCADFMTAGDAANRLLGIELISIGPGQAVVTMQVSDQMLNAHGTCHGGFLFTLADAAFAYASNTHNQVAVAQNCTITFIAPANRGDRLVARAVERTRVARSGVYDVTITREEGMVIAEFRGISRTTGNEILPGMAAKGVPQPVDTGG